MLLEFFKRRKATLKGNYLFLVGAGQVVELELGIPQEVPNQIAYKILDQDGDIVRIAEAPAAEAAAKRAPRTKMVGDETITKA